MLHSCRLRLRQYLAGGMLILAAQAIIAQPAAADPITGTYNLDQSNALTDGVVYGTVKVEAFKSLGEVKITYTADPSPYSSIGPNFGFHTVGFNTDLKLTKAQISAPSKWKPTAKANLSSFGVFSWKEETSNNPLSTVTLLITGLGANATLGHFTLPSSGGQSEFFAGHIIDFNLNRCDTTSHWVAGSTEPGAPPPPGGQGGPPPPGGQGGPPSAPEPSTLAMAAVGLCGLGLCRRRRRT